MKSPVWLTCKGIIFINLARNYTGDSSRWNKKHHLERWGLWANQHRSFKSKLPKWNRICLVTSQLLPFFMSNGLSVCQCFASCGLQSWPKTCLLDKAYERTMQLRTSGRFTLLGSGLSGSWMNQNLHVRFRISSSWPSDTSKRTIGKLQQRQHKETNH